MLLIVSNQYRDTYKYRRKLSDFGLRFENGKWRLQTSDENLEDTIYRFCRRKHLHFESIKDKYVRSNDYRKNFMKQYKKHDGIFYRCAYCGKKLQAHQMTVDHIISIDKVQHSAKYRLYMKLFGLNSINDTRNLAPACEKCNKSKSNKVRGYLIQGMTGRTYRGVIIRRWVKFFLFVAVAAALVCLVNRFFPEQVKQATEFGEKMIHLWFTSGG